MDDNGDLTLQWVEEVGNVIHEEVICGLEAELDAPVEEVVGACEEVTVEETVESVVEDSTPIADTEILMVPQTSDMESIYIVPQDQGHDYLNIQVTEEVITDNWDRSGPDDGMEVPETKVSHDNLLEYDDMEIPLPIDQDSYTNTRPYPCDFCSKRFRKKANLMNHMVTHQTERPHGCNLCGARYVRKSDLMNHLKIHAYAPSRDGLEDDLEDPLATEEEENHPIKGRRKRIQTNVPRKRKAPPGANKRIIDDGPKLDMSKWTDQLTSNEQQVSRWPITDTTKPYVCQFCGVGFAREKALASHSRIHGGDSPFECTSCGEMFWDINTLQEHMRIKHGIGIVQSDQDEIENESTYAGDERFGEFFCDTCGVPFHRLDLLKRHRKIHIKQEIDTLEGSSQHHVCNVCGEWFEEALALLAHAELHASRSPSRRCLLCGEKCRDDAELAEHVREMHAEDAPPNTCVLCGKTCKDKRSLLKHSWIHSTDKTFGCTKCGKRFHSKARLRRHMVSHRNKMVACDECGEEFPDGRALVSHRHSHNKDLGGRTFPCRECGKTFGSRSSQQIHIRIHTGERPYGCRFCWKAFADGGTLRKHERIHTGEKPYGCAICPRAFNQRVVLREHVRAHHSGPDPKCHNSLTPYMCKVCGDTLPTSDELVAHIVAHCDENTAMRRQPQSGPRKYKRRRKLKHEGSSFGSRVSESFDMLDGPSDSDENTKRKLGKKTKQHRSNVEESYQNVLKSFESSLQNINSIVSNSKTYPTKTKTPKKKVKKDEKKIGTPAAVSNAEVPAANHPGRPKMIHTQKTRVPVEIGTDGVKKGQKTKTMVTRTPKVIPSEQQKTPGQLPSGERNRPRTKNVSYHVEGRQQLAPATFPKPRDGEIVEAETSTDVDTVNIKVEPGLQKLNANQNHATNNNGNIIEFKQEKIDKMEKPTVKRRVAMKRTKRRQTTGARRLKEKTAQIVVPDLPNNNNVTVEEDETLEEDTGAMVVEEEVQPTQLFESVVDGNNLEVAFEANVVSEQDIIQESILPDLDKVNHVEEIGASPGSVKLSVKVEATSDGILDVHSLIGSVEESVPETIIPDTIEYTCEMCAAVFSTRAELLVHVPIHI
ncbi:PREDICTED: zinc finger protein 850 [Ceratosolen solmsi marchali]|uniref:Zinc finger protein 850 n=1 Tax=Ceratosolen solmsi marchali TaxID=326594 RepID=A0AAJ6YSG4_9HYME|nr:PREDICTED: zinc finger protein 850 [Ceratosolen solmsi marchali]XP_011503403.1 PREDICTED: zinc finger protein 850 [Ceratosolen solmsi marchali]XP_011503404.1 PREDICTED: zinc finger protein 850 [Ceratosolen solmsi marchali]